MSKVLHFKRIHCGTPEVEEHEDVKRFGGARS